MKLSAPVDARKLRVALAERGLPKWRVATEIGIHPGDMARYVSGKRQAPADFRTRIEKALGLADGELDPAA